jgi:Mrp family chromosome partitioning ATPase
MLCRAKYTAEASLRVLPTYDAGSMLGFENPSMPNIEYHSFVQQQVFEIANPETIIDALKLLGPKASLWQQPTESARHAAERLMAVLKVNWVPDTFLISVSLDGTKPTGLADIVNAVVNAYLSRQEKQELSGTDQRVHLLQQRRDDLQRTLDSERSQLDQLTQELGVTTFRGPGANPYDLKLSGANVALERQQRQLIEDQSRLAALQAGPTAPNQNDLDSLAQKLLLDDHDLDTQVADLKKEREDAFLQLQGLSQNHPGRPALEQKIADIDAEARGIHDDALREARSTLLAAHAADLHGKIAVAQTQVDESQRALAGIQQEIASLKQSAASFGSKYNQALAIHDEYENHLKELSEVDDRVDVMRVQSRSPGVASLELPALEPDAAQVGKKRSMLILLTGLGMLVAGIGVPCLVDLTDPTVKSAHEIERVFKLPVLGSTGSEDRSERDALRRIALGIIRERRQAGTRVFVVTAVGEKAGTTSLTLALSKELTELGVSAVAVEANASAPDIRYEETKAGSGFPVKLVSQEAGRNGILMTSESAESEARALAAARGHSIRQAMGGLPERMPICAHQRNDRLMAPCIREVIDQVLSSHDLVLLDAPPVLKSADTAMLIHHPAGVVLAVSAGRDRLPDIGATLRELNRLSPPVIGIVVRQNKLTPTAVVQPSRLPLLASRVERATAGVFSGSAAASVTRADLKPEIAG